MANNNLTPEETEDLKIRREKLLNAYTSGVASISHNGKTTTFRSLNDLKAALDAIDTLLGKKKTKIIKTITKRGV